MSLALQYTIRFLTHEENIVDIICQFLFYEMETTGTRLTSRFFSDIIIKFVQFISLKLFFHSKCCEKLKTHFVAK